MTTQKNDTNYTIGVDIGGTKMSAVLFDLEKKEIISDYKLSTPIDNFDKFLVMLYALIDPLVEKAKKDKLKIGHIGIGVAGMIDQPTEKNLEGKILKCPNIEILNNQSLGKLIFNKYKINTSLDNDANCFLRAEASLGSAKNTANAIGVTLGTGIGGAISIDNKVYQGVHGSAGEIGHMIIDVVEDTPHTLEEIYHNLTQANPQGLAEEAYEGDKLATKVYEELGHLIGIALANVVNLFDPEVIVIGGGVMQSSDLFMTELKKSLKEEIISPKLKKIKVLPAKLENSGAIGAALLS